jgi:hypothetical protein
MEMGDERERRTGTDVMIFKKFLPKNLPKNIGVFLLKILLVFGKQLS